MLFFVLSGFLKAYNHLEDDERKLNYKGIVSLCILGNISTVCSLILWESMGNYFDYKAILALINSFFFLQSWIPHVYYNYFFCTITWFLSTLFFCYILTPIAIKVIHTIRANRIRVLFIVVVLKCVLEVIISLVASDMMEHYYSYIFPPFRFIDYFCGLLLGSSYIYDIKIKKNLYSICEVITVLLFMLASWVCSNISHFNYGTILLVPTLFMIYTFAFERGICSKLFGSKIMQFISKRTKYYFVTHIVTLQYTRYYINNLIIGTVAALIITIIVSEMYILFERNVDPKEYN